MPKLFISYRRNDTQMVAGRLRESLARYVGNQTIFRDKNSIAPGEDWTKAIDEELSENTVVLALIGPSWATARDETGQRCLEDPADWNRVELEHALERRSRVIPLLVDDAKMPAPSDLPEGLSSLAYSNALKLRDDDWDSDISRLVGTLHISRRWPRMRRLAMLAMLATLVVGVAGYSWPRGQVQSPSVVPPTTVPITPVVSGSGFVQDPARQTFDLDMGDVQSESGYLLDNWGPTDYAGWCPDDKRIEWQCTFSSPSGDRTKRYMSIRSDNFVIFNGVAVGKSYSLYTEVEDGKCTDNFRIFIGENQVYLYKGTSSKNSGLIDAVIYPHIIPVDGSLVSSARLRINFKNEATDNCGAAGVYRIILTPTM